MCCFYAVFCSFSPSLLNHKLFLLLMHEKKRRLLQAQRLELTEHILYRKLASAAHGKNKRVLQEIAEMEHHHYDFFKQLTKQDVQPFRLKLFFYYILSRIFGVTFGVKLMEHEEKAAQELYKHIIHDVPHAKDLLEDEEKHERQIIDMLRETKLEYISSIVLGLNDALVELTGALAGLTFAFQKTSLIAVAGIVTGLAASLSMAASEYLSTKAEHNRRKPVTAALYTGVAYLCTVIVLVLPFLLLEQALVALAITLGLGLVIIFLFTFYSAVTRHENFWHKFMEMALISFGVAGFSFVVGMLLRTLVGVEV